MLIGDWRLEIGDWSLAFRGGEALFNDANDEMMLMMRMMLMMDRYFLKRLRVVIMLEVSILIISSASVYKLLNSSSEIYSVAFNSSNQ